jgi:hypothetical protein
VNRGCVSSRVLDGAASACLPDSPPPHKSQVQSNLTSTSHPHLLSTRKIIMQHLSRHLSKDLIYHEDSPTSLPYTRGRHSS